MKKTEVRNPKVRCGTCRMFDGYTWCRHWNFFTAADSPPCRFYSRRPDESAVPGPAEHEAGEQGSGMPAGTAPC